MEEGSRVRNGRIGRQCHLRFAVLGRACNEKKGMSADDQHTLLALLHNHRLNAQLCQWGNQRDIMMQHRNEKVYAVRRDRETLDRRWRHVSCSIQTHTFSQLLILRAACLPESKDSLGVVQHGQPVHTSARALGLI